jgi:hypothetical protein
VGSSIRGGDGDGEYEEASGTLGGSALIRVGSCWIGGDGDGE